ncbi:MAG: hypothetical protein QG574_5360 [Cyanobacteriota bacterium erpe_2018_sw_21hr_WHONDRS-SW48-000092_B_bin.40]|jgi:hypothetical protein|nr:hypothetical protein [Cyanobacteriota bacterium erpe_2018_sw_21hr_WHONDRS-SW48-000092_B_bin.40]
MKQSIQAMFLLLFLINAFVVVPAARALDEKRLSHNRAVVDSRKILKVSKKLYGGVDEVNYALLAAGITLESDHLPAIVGSVRLGSPSFHAGLVEKDKVLSASIVERKLNLLFEREGKRYAISLHTAPAVLTPDIPISDRMPLSASVIKTPLLGEAEKIKEIAKYDLVILIDISGSMNWELASERQSKWQWCTKFVSTFADKVMPSLAGRGITIVPFNGTYSIISERTPAQVVGFFKNTDAIGSTNLGSPLKDVLGRFMYSARQRPLLVVVLTDGMPNSGPTAESVLIEFSKQMHSEREVRVLILEVGEDSVSNAFLKYLDDYLVNDGAKYDFVDVTKFEELKKTTFIDALQKSIAERPISSTTKAIQTEIDQLKAEITRQREIESKSEIELKPRSKLKISK